MTGRGKKRAGESSEKQPKKQKPSGDWCADCWTVVKDACRGSHQLLAKPAALKAAQAQLKKLQDEVKVAQARLDKSAEAVVPVGPVLKVHVDGTDDDGFHVDGGSISITLAAAKVTAAEKKAICGALEGVDIDFSDMDTPTTRANFTHLGSFERKLPVYVVGQKKEKGAVFLVGGGDLQFCLSTSTCGSSGLKLFGHIRNQTDLQSLQASGCEGDDCRYTDLDCYCRTHFNGSTTVSKAKFVA